MKIGEILQRYRKNNDLSQRQFAIKCELSNGYISILEKGINPKTGKPVTPTLTQMKKLADGMDMSLTELLEKADDIYIEFAGNYPYKDFLGHSLPDNILPMPEMKKVPLLGSIACGAPILAEEHIEGYVETPASIHADFTLRCKGDSMINARIFDGDLVYIRQQEEVLSGEIAAVLIDGEATLKRVRIHPDRLILEPANPLYDPLVFRGEEMNEVRILGKAVAFTSIVQ